MCASCQEKMKRKLCQNTMFTLSWKKKRDFTAHWLLQKHYNPTRLNLAYVTIACENSEDRKAVSSSTWKWSILSFKYCFSNCLGYVQHEQWHCQEAWYADFCIVVQPENLTQLLCLFKTASLLQKIFKMKVLI